MFAFFQFFALPAAMAVGGALVSVPIIIHLINRMRFRRVRWAAMEFLLKSQKRNRRRLIIEQLLLLAMRCMLVLLAAFLVAQFVGCDKNANGGDVKKTFHVVVIDDTPSMKDEWADQGVHKDSFSEAKDRVIETAKFWNSKGGQNEMRVIRLSRAKGDPVYDGPIGDQDLPKLKTALDNLTCSDVRAEPKDGLEAAQAYFADHPAGTKLLYLVSDFRSINWSGPAADALTGPSGLVEGLLKANVSIDLIDTADPPRPESTGQADGHHDNIGIVDLQSESSVAAVGAETRLTVTVQNFTGQEYKNLLLTIRINGQERHDLGGDEKDSAPPMIPTLKANSLTSYSFPVTFREPGKNLISVTLPEKLFEVGLRADDTRFAVVKVRDKVETLVVSGDAGKGEDASFLKALIEQEKGQEVVNVGVEALDKGGLEEYPMVYLVNVPELPTERALKNLMAYVRQGGNLVTFLGERTVSGYWNDKMYNKGDGLLPVRLAESPHVDKWNEQQQQDRRLAGQEYLFLRAPTHPAWADAQAQKHRFESLLCWGYWPTEKPRDQWQRTDKNRLEEWATLANEKPVSAYVTAGNALVDRLNLTDAKFQQYLPGLKFYQSVIKDRLSSGKTLGAVADAIEKLLNDTGEDQNPNRPNLKELFEQPEMQTLRQDVESFREEVQYGAPLVLTHKLGQGRVVTFLTGVDDKWNNWASDGLVAPTWVIAMRELRRYLGSSESSNYMAGAPLTLDLDATRYSPTVVPWYQAEPQRVAGGGAQPVGVQGGKTRRDPIKLEPEEGRLRLTYTQTEQPGAYHFVLTLLRLKLNDQSFVDLAKENIAPETLVKLERLKNQEFEKEDDFAAELDKILTPAEAPLKPTIVDRAKTVRDERSYVFNVDTLGEGDLRRARFEELVKNNPPSPENGRGTILMHGIKAGTEGGVIDKAKKNDLSESPWLFLIILVILVLEQMLAVHLSFHLRGHEAQLPAATGTATPQAA